MHVGILVSDRASRYRADYFWGSGQRWYALHVQDQHLRQCSSGILEQSLHSGKTE
jgi:hypothetical protein